MQTLRYNPLVCFFVWAVVLTTATRARLSYPRNRAEAERLDLDQSTALPRVELASMRRQHDQPSLVLPFTCAAPGRREAPRCTWLRSCMSIAEIGLS